MAEAFVTRLDGPAVESDIAKDMLKRALWVTPAFLLVSGLIWGVNGAISTGYAIALVVLNLLLSAALLSWTARISLSLMMAAALGGFILRLGIVFAAFWIVKDASWMKVVPFCITVVVTHLGLLFWETRYVSASLAFPGLKPDAKPAERTSMNRTSMNRTSMNRTSINRKENRS